MNYYNFFSLNLNIFNFNKMKTHIWNHLKGQTCPVSTVGWSSLSCYVVKGWQSNFCNSLRVWTDFFLFLKVRRSSRGLLLCIQLLHTVIIIMCIQLLPTLSMNLPWLFIMCIQPLPTLSMNLPWLSIEKKEVYDPHCSMSRQLIIIFFCIFSLFL